MTIFSKPVIITGAIGLISWAIWYDHYRRSKPDYKSKLVTKRKSELLLQREANDPLAYVKKLPLVDDCLDQNKISMHTMQQIQIGEQFLEAGDITKGAAHVAIGLAYMDQRQIVMTMQQLAMALPQQVIRAIQQNLQVAKARAQAQYLKAFTGAKRSNDLSSVDRLAKSERVVIEEVTNEEKLNDPVDVDSIDGDTEEPKIVDLSDDNGGEEVDELEADVVIGEPVESRQVEVCEDVDSIDGDSENVAVKGEVIEEEETVELIEDGLDENQNEVGGQIDEVDDEVVEISSDSEEDYEEATTQDKEFEILTDSMEETTVTEQELLQKFGTGFHESPQVIQTGCAEGDLDDSQILNKTIGDASEADAFFSPVPATSKNLPQGLVEVETGDHASDAVEAE